MERSNKIDFGKYFLTAKFRVEILNVWDGVPIRDGDSIEGPVIPTWTPRTVLLRDHMKRARPVALGRTANSHFHHKMKFPFGGLQLVRGKAARFSCNRGTMSYNAVSGVVTIRGEVRFLSEQVRILLEDIIIFVVGLQHMNRIIVTDLIDLTILEFHRVTVDKTFVFDVNQEVEVTDEVSTYNGALNVSYNKGPNTLFKIQIDLDSFSTIGFDN